MSTLAKRRISPPIMAQCGPNSDGTVWIAFGLEGAVPSPVAFPGTMQEARQVIQALNSVPIMVRALKAVRADVRDQDTDTFIARATADQVDEALFAAGGRA